MFFAAARVKMLFVTRISGNKCITFFGSNFSCRCREIMLDRGPVVLSPINFNSRILSLIIPLLPLLKISLQNTLFVRCGVT